MAEIPIERRESSRGWIWGLVAAVVVALLLWWWVAERNDDVASAGEVTPPVVAEAPVAPVAVPNAATTGAPVDAFLSWVDATGSQHEASVSHDYVATGITRLAGAIADLSAADSLGGSSRAQQVQALNRMAEQVQQDPAATSHADVVRAAFLSSAALLGDIQQRRFPAAATVVGDVRSAADAIAKDRPLLDQKAQVDRFFERAAAAVRAMSAR